MYMQYKIVLVNADIKWMWNNIVIQKVSVQQRCLNISGDIAIK